jgi:glycosyltransferase involved in cell wall biosynthesis
MPYGSVGGMERLAFTFYQHYKSLGYNVKAVKIIKLDNDIINFGEDEYHLSSIDFAGRSSLNRMVLYFRAPRLIRKIIRQNDITHSISFGDMANTFSSLTFTNEFKIGSIHALKSVEFVSKSIFNRIFKLSYKTSYRYFDKVVCISSAIKSDLIENCGFRFVDKLEVIYNPHNIETINRMAIEPLETAHEEQLFATPVVIFIGRLSMQKSPWHLIKAFALLLKKESDATLVFIGDGDKIVESYIAELTYFLNIEDRVKFLGRKDNPYKYLKRSRVLALSSYYEGTPNVIVEAMGLAVPVVTSLCTEGILELMSLRKRDFIARKIYTEAGIVTPNFYKGSLRIPEERDFTLEEQIMAEALQEVLGQSQYKTGLQEQLKDLLVKFDLEEVAQHYLQPIKARTKIVFSTDQVFRHGGIEKTMAEKANYFADVEGYDVMIITTEQLGQSPRYPLSPNVRLIDLGINYSRRKSYLHIDNLRRIPKHFSKSKTIFSSIKPDVIITSNYAYDFYWLPFICRKAIKFKEFHSSKRYQSESRSKNTNIFVKFKYWVNDVIKARYDRLILLNPDEQQYYESDKLAVIPNSISPSPLTARLQNKRAVAAGRIAPVKGFDHLIKAWKLVTDREPDWQLDIYGEDYDGTQEQLEELISKLNLIGKVQFAGVTDEMPETMLDYSLYLMSSETECFPMVLLEAMAIGLPIVSYDCPTGPRNIVTDGEDGFLVEDQNISALADKILLLIKDDELRQTFGKNAKQNSKRFENTTVMTRWKELLKDTLKKND